jgi:hypothetical protein
LCHYGWPDDIDIWEPGFVDRFGRFAQAAARLIRDETDRVPIFCPVNEISYWSWAGGDQARFHPGTRGRGDELKRQLVRASIAGIEAVRGVDPRARIVHVDPVINVVAGRPKDAAQAAAYNDAQFHGWDMLAGRLLPELGGRPDYLDIIGVNFYCENQWFYGGCTIPLGHHEYRPFGEILTDVHRRYGRPILVAETGAEGGARAIWLHYVAAEVRAAMAEGALLQGVCLYPILEYPGWDNDRHCNTGLLCKADGDGRRRVHQSLAEELHRQQSIFAALAAAEAPRLRLMESAA